MSFRGTLPELPGAASPSSRPSLLAHFCFSVITRTFPIARSWTFSMNCTLNCRFLQLYAYWVKFFGAQASARQHFIASHSVLHIMLMLASSAFAFVVVGTSQCKIVLAYCLDLIISLGLGRRARYKPYKVHTYIHYTSLLSLTQIPPLTY